MLDINKIRQDFPILRRQINGHPLAYLDNAATTQKPQQVINVIVDFYQNHNANIHRGVHTISEEATQLYDQARETVAKFINVKQSEIVFVRNATEGINLIANTWGQQNLKKDDEIVLSKMEHHSNIVPWQMIAQKTGAKLRYINVDIDGRLVISDLANLINNKTKIVSLVHISNTLGVLNPLREIFSRVKKYNKQIICVADVSQSISHLSLDPNQLKADFLTFSGHKMLGPMGIGVLWGKKGLLKSMSPFLGGGDMISEVYLEHAIYAEVPQKFEAGTPNVPGAIGLAAACDYLSQFDFLEIQQHLQKLSKYFIGNLKTIDFVTPINFLVESGIVAFTVNNVHAHDVAQVFDSQGIAVRSGQHCTMPLHDQLNLLATTRVSTYIYNTQAEIDKVIDALYKVKQIFNL